jgi:cytochrome d ubiquinol oxidase subunit II
MHLDLNTIWFILVGVLFTGYAMLDGFDLGIGALHLFTKDDQERRVLLNSIGPVWDGNEVWLVTGGGACSPRFLMCMRRSSPVFTSRFICCSRR